MPDYLAGAAYVRVRPDLRGFQTEIKPEAKKLGESVGATIGSAIQKGIAKGIGDGLGEGTRRSLPKSKEDGGRLGRTFADSFKQRVKAALATLPDAKIGANTTPAQRRIAELRADLARLDDAKIGVDVDANAAAARIDYIRSELDRLSHDDPNIDVRVDTARAASELAAVNGEADRLNGKSSTITIRANNASALSSIREVRAALIALGASTVVPVGAAIAGALGGIAAGGAAAAAGLGGIAAVAVPAFKKVSEATKAEKAAQDAATLSSLQGAQQAGQSAAQRVQAANRVANAQLSLQQAQRQAARASVQSAQRVADAQRNLSRVRAQAGYAQQRALRQVGQAEQQLQNAQYSAAAAQRDLNAARQQATRNLQDMELQALSAGVAQEQAQLDLQRAGQQLQTLEKSGTATTEQLKQARLDYMRANIRVRRTTLDASRATKDYTTAQAKGVAGSDLVVRAQHRVNQANQQVQNSQQALADAQANVARVRQQSAQKIADAQRQVTRAQQAQAAQAQASQAAITRAQRALSAAQLAQAQSAQKAAQGSSAARNAALKYQMALAKLTPAERDLKNAVDGAKDAFKSWYKNLEPAVLPQITKAVGLLKPALNAMTPIVKGAAAGFGTFLDQVGALFRSPALHSLSVQFGQMAKTAIPLFGKSMINLGMAFGQLLVAFRPITHQLLQGLVSLTQKFRDWTSTLSSSSGFHQFIAYVQKNGPKLIHVLGQIGHAFVEIAKAIAPLGPLFLDAIGNTAKLVSKFVDAHPKITAFIAGIAAANKILKPFRRRVFRVVGAIGELVKAFKGREAAAWATNVSGAVKKVGNVAGKVGRGLQGIGKAAFGLTGIIGGIAGAGLVAAVGALAAGFAGLVGWSYKTVTSTDKSTQAIVKNANSYRQAKAALDAHYHQIKRNADEHHRLLTVQGRSGDAAILLANTLETTAGKQKQANDLFARSVQHVAAELGVTLTKAYIVAKRNGIDLTKGFQGNSKAAQDNRNKLQALVTQINLTKDPTKLAAAGFSLAADKTQKWKDRVDGLTSALNGLIGINVGVVQAQINFKNSTGALTQSIKKNGTSLDANTTKGRANRQAILDAVQAAIQHSKAVYRQSHDLDKATGALKTDEGAIYDNATANGVNTGAVHDFLKKLGATPGQAAAALKGMQKFAKGTNDALDGVKNKNIAINAKGEFVGVLTDGYYRGHAKNSSLRAAGGPISGPGTGTSDSIPAVGPGGQPYRLSNGEHVWTAKEVQAVGGHGAMMAMRRSIVGRAEGGPIGLAMGGPTIVGTKSQAITTPNVNDWLSLRLAEWAEKIGSKLRSMLGGVFRNGAVAGPSAKAAMAYAASVLGHFGWGPGQMGPLVSLWNGESGWRWWARNPSSGAYGIPQALPASKMAAAGADWRTNPATQINWGLSYIANRYHTPAAAYGAWLSRHPHWYDQGGPLQPGYTLAYNGTGKTEMVLTNDQWSQIVKDGGATTIYETNNYASEGMSIHQFANEVVRQLAFEMRG